MIWFSIKGGNDMKTTWKVGLAVAVLGVLSSSYALAAESASKDPFAGVSWKQEKAINHQRKDKVKKLEYHEPTQIVAEADVNEADMNYYYGAIRVGTDAIVEMNMHRNPLSLRAIKGYQFKKYPAGIVITSGRVVIDGTQGIDIYAEGTGYRQGILVQGRETMKGSQGYFGRGKSNLVINNTDSDDDVVRIRIGNDLYKPGSGFMQEHEPLVRIKGEVGGYASLVIKGRVDFENSPDTDPTTRLEPYKMGGKVLSVFKGDASIGSGRLVTDAPIAIYAGFSEVYTANIRNSAPAFVKINSSLPDEQQVKGIRKAIPTYQSDVVIKGMVWIEANSTAAVSLVTPKSFLQGAFMGNEKYSYNYLTLRNHAQWINYRNDVHPAMKTYQQYSNVVHSHLTTLDAGATPSSYGFIDQADSLPLTIENFSGHARVLYRYNDEDPIFAKKGNVEIGRAEKGSSILLFTDKYDEIAKSDPQKSDVLKKLARKLVYHGAATKTAPGTSEQMAEMSKKALYDDGSDPKTYLLAGVGLVETLTRPEETIICGRIDFDEAGIGVFHAEKPESFIKELKNRTNDNGTNLEELVKENKEDKKDPVDPGKKDPVDPGKKEDSQKGDKESPVVEATKTAIFSGVLSWNAQNNDLAKRLGDVRLSDANSGIWAKYQGGSAALDTTDTKKNTVKWDEKYNGIQVGYDKVMGDWTIGGAFSYLKNDDTYVYGTGKGHTLAGAIYGTQVKEDGTYVDIIAKVGQVKNDYDVHTKDYEEATKKGDRIQGTYQANGVLLSFEYGKRIEKENGFYFEPSAELTMSQLGAYDETIQSVNKKAEFKAHADSVNSMVGKLSLAVGQKTEAMNFYGKLSVAHEFSGDIKSSFSANDYPVNTEIKLEDTWLDLELGGSYKMSEDSYLYGTFSKNFGAKLDNKWRLDAGIRFAF